MPRTRSRNSAREVAVPARAGTHESHTGTRQPGHRVSITGEPQCFREVRQPPAKVIQEFWLCWQETRK